MLVASATTVHAANGQLDYRILATAKTSTMEQELNYAAQSGYRFSKVMGFASRLLLHASFPAGIAPFIRP
jgi:hypothetical protein